MEQQSHGSESSPGYLYRYFSKQWAESLLLKGKMFFPCVADFNDPFDCCAQVTFASRAKRKRYARKLISERLAHLPKHERKKVAKKAEKAQAYKIAHERFLKQLHEEVGVLCFSEKCDDILMWSHYAKSHTGLCVEFSRSRYLTFALRVQYVEEYPTLDFFKAMDDMQQPFSAQARSVVDRIYLSKAIDWKYEKEWRLPAFVGPYNRQPSEDVPSDLLYGGKGLHDFPTNLITRVFLGCRMMDPDKEEVMEWIRRGPAKPKIYEARANEGSYTLDMLELR